MKTTKAVRVGHARRGQGARQSCLKGFWHRHVDIDDTFGHFSI